MDTPAEHHVTGKTVRKWGWGCGQKDGHKKAPEGVMSMYTYQKKVVALPKYKETQSITTTIRILGYPGRETLYRWISEKGQPPKEKSAFRGVNTQKHLRHPSVELYL